MFFLSVLFIPVISYGQQSSIDANLRTYNFHDNFQHLRDYDIRRITPTGSLTGGYSRSIGKRFLFGGFIGYAHSIEKVQKLYGPQTINGITEFEFIKNSYQFVNLGLGTKYYFTDGNTGFYLNSDLSCLMYTAIKRDVGLKQGMSILNTQNEIIYARSIITDEVKRAIPIFGFQLGFDLPLNRVHLTAALCLNIKPFRIRFDSLETSVFSGGVNLGIRYVLKEN